MEMEFPEFDVDDFIYSSPPIQIIEALPSPVPLSRQIKPFTLVTLTESDQEKSKPQPEQAHIVEDDILIPGTPDRSFHLSSQPSTTKMKAPQRHPRKSILEEKENDDHSLGQRVSLIIDSSSSSSSDCESKLPAHGLDSNLPEPVTKSTAIYTDGLDLADLSWDDADDVFDDPLAIRPQPNIASSVKHVTEPSMHFSPLSSSPVYISPATQSRATSRGSIAMASTVPVSVSISIPDQIQAQDHVQTMDSASSSVPIQSLQRSRPDEPYYYSDEPLSPLKHFYSLEDLERLPEMNYMAEYFKGQFDGTSKKSRRKLSYLAEPETAAMGSGSSKPRRRTPLSAAGRKRNSYPSAYSAADGDEEEFSNGATGMARVDDEEDGYPNDKKKKKWPSNYAAFRRKKSYGRRSAGS